MRTFDNAYGWTERKLPVDISTAVQLIPSKANNRIIVRRIRGTLSGALNIVSRRDSNSITEYTQAAGTVDVPGLQIALPPEAALFVQGSVTDADAYIQYGYEPVGG